MALREVLVDDQGNIVNQGSTTNTSNAAPAVPTFQNEIGQSPFTNVTGTSGTGTTGQTSNTGTIGQVPNQAVTQTPSSASTPVSQSSGGSSSGMDITSGIFDDVSKVINNMSTMVQTGESAANSVFNRNMQREQWAAQKPGIASNLLGAKMQQAQSNITFGQGQADRQTQMANAGAFMSGIASGLRGSQK
jgi:hypothetical protein